MRERFTGLLLGGAVGDALGLPAEGLSPKRKRALFGRGWRHRFVWGRGMLSDDTEHTFFVAQALLTHPRDPKRFQVDLARRLRYWLMGLPAGVGFATLRAVLKLWLGWSPGRAGVWSAGNGPAMRAPLIGAYFADDTERQDAFLRASTQLTHMDPRALIGARAVARTAAVATLSGDAVHVPALLATLDELSPDSEWRRCIGVCRSAWRERRSVASVAGELGLAGGVGGYVLHTVPIALYSFLLHGPRFAETLEAVLDCGGDTDTVGSIAGALVGAAAGRQGIPPEWVDGIVDRPISPALLAQLGERLAEQRGADRTLGPIPYAWPLTPLRNLAFLVIVLAHGFRRALPPY